MAKLRFKRSPPATSDAPAADAASLPPAANLNNGDVTVKFSRSPDAPNDKTDSQAGPAADPQTSRHGMNEGHRTASIAPSSDAQRHPSSYSGRKAAHTTKRSRFSNPYSYRFDKYYQPPSNSGNVGSASASAGAGAGSSSFNLIDSNHTTTTRGNSTNNATKKRGALAAVLRSFSQFAAAATTPAHATTPTTTTTTTTSPVGSNTTTNSHKPAKSSITSKSSANSNENTPTLKRSSTESNLTTTTTTTATQPLSTKAPPPPYCLRGIDELLRRNSVTSIDNGGVAAEKKTNSDDKDYLRPALIECPLCVSLVDQTAIPKLDACHHKVCYECMQRYITVEINHSRVNIKCPVCSEAIHPNTIRRILNDEKLYLKYETFMLRRVLAADPDARWCPAPDCGYVVLAYGCASCPKLMCQRPNCKTSFCYHCKQEWHPNQTCSSASIQRNRYLFESAGINLADSIEQSSNDINIITATYATDNNQDDPTGTSANNGSSKGRKSSKSSQQTLILKPEDVKECPVCSSRIIKMNDGSCNHMTCSICETEFCWLCMKEISDLHYFSPSGCTFWGKKPWSRKKKLLWRLGILVGAPICIIFIAGIAVPAIVIGIPVWAARKLHNILERKQLSRYRKNAIITGGVLLAFAASPFISAFALAVGIPFLLGYVYGVVPLSLCRSSGGCLSTSASVEHLPQQPYQSATAQAAINPTTNQQSPSIPASSGSRLSVTATESRLSAASIRNVTNNDVVSIGTATSHKLGNPSIGETSVYTSNMSLETNSLGRVTSVEREDRESASNAALAGSIISGQVDDGYSTKALAGSIISKESGYTLVPAEIHNNGININKQQDQ